MKKKHKERKRGNKTGIRSIDDVTISQCVVIRIGKKKRQKLIRLLHVRYIASKATFSWRGEW